MRDREQDLDAFAGEVTAREPPRRERAWVSRLGHAARTGMHAGLWPGLGVFAIYYATNRALPMPWLKIASLAALFGPFVGVSLAVITEALVIAFDRVARIGYGLGALANPVTAGALGGALAGVAPGAIGVAGFGSFHGPYAGTLPLAGGAIAGAMLVAVPLARRARRERWPHAPDGRAIAAAAVIATVILCALAAAVAPAVSAIASAETMRGLIPERALFVGAIAGAAGGAVVGLFNGLVIALGRTLQPPRPAPPPRSPDLPT